MRNWVLPEYVEDILPPLAQRIERLRRDVLDLFLVYGYELVMPPMIEYLESLLTGTGHDLDLKTFKLVDQLSGRMIGLRADITPQVARIDAHLLNRDGVTRMCYCGSVLHALPSGMMGTREPMQIGAELYGHAGIESDIEILQLMLEALRISGVPGLHLDLGHVGLFRAIVRHADIAPALEGDLFQALQAKDTSSLRELTRTLNRADRDALLLLPQLFGDAEVLEEARAKLPALPEIAQSLDELKAIVVATSDRVGEVLIDLAELRGYHYHSGIVFAAYAKGSANAVALGGRYDEVGKAFGRARPATGFSLHLRELAALVPDNGELTAILAPYGDEPSLAAAIRALRDQGEVVIVDLPGHTKTARDARCTRKLEKNKHGVWEPVLLRAKT